MSIQAYFENIQDVIAEQLSDSKKSIIIAVAWFTDQKLFQILCDKANSKIHVELLLLNDRINKSSGIDYDRLVSIGGKVWRIEYEEGTKKLMHNKFCVIDNNIVISGSYNWTKKARLNHESITVVSDNEELAVKFTNEFKSILELHFGKDSYSLTIDYNGVCSRLTTLREAIKTGDIEAIDYLAERLTKYLAPYHDSNFSNLHQIIILIQNKSYSEVISLIDTTINCYSSITTFINPRIIALRLELKALEIQICALENEKAELDKLLHDFEIQHNKELGELLLKILKIRKDLYLNQFHDDPNYEYQYKEAEKDYNKYSKGYSKQKNEQINILSRSEISELKELYRAASKLCHPDTVVGERERETAEEIFKSLSTAYRNNDLDEVRRIHGNLRNRLFNIGSDVISEDQLLVNRINELRMKRSNIERIINRTKNSDTYKTIEEIRNWSDYFQVLKKQLIKELHQLEIELSQWKKIEAKK